MGDILRIDVNGTPYTIPADNPFVNTAAKPEIYAYGFRNPFRFSFDMGGTHQLLAGDEGQSLYEEVDLVTKGGNYGWNVKEGTHCFDTDNDHAERSSCPSVDSAGKPLLDPVIEMVNSSNPKGSGWASPSSGDLYTGEPHCPLCRESTSSECCRRPEERTANYSPPRPRPAACANWSTLACLKIISSPNTGHIPKELRAGSAW